MMQYLAGALIIVAILYGMWLVAGWLITGGEPEIYTGFLDLLRAEPDETIAEALAHADDKSDGWQRNFVTKWGSIYSGKLNICTDVTADDIDHVEYVPVGKGK